MPRTPTTLPAFIVDVDSRIDKQCYYTDRLNVNTSCTLRKRFRSLNDNDRCSAFSGVTGNWMTTVDTQGIYTFNIIQPMVRTNASVMQNANVKIAIAPRYTKDTKSQMASEVATSIVEQKNRLQWTDKLEEFIALEQQLGPGVFVRTFHNPHLKRKHSVPIWDKVQVEMPGMTVCANCGQQSPFTRGTNEEQGETTPDDEMGELPPQMPQDDETAECSSCGAMAMVETQPKLVSMDVPTGLSEFSTGATDTVAIPFFEIRIDDQDTQGGNLERAKWMQHHFLASVDELELEYPESAEQIKGASAELSYALQWQQVLKRARRTPTDLSSDQVIEQREVKDIFLTPSMYLNQPISTDFQLKDKDGKVRFSVKKDKTLGDAEFEGQKFEEPPVLCFRLVGTALVDVYPCDFREEFSYITFLRNSSSFWGAFLYDAVSLQDIINHVLTIQVYHIRRNAITSIVYNRNSFDPESFSEDLIPTKDTIPPDIPIGQQFGIIPALQMSGEPMQMFEMLQGLKSDVTLTTPAMMGQSQPGEPYHAQLLQKQSSLGLLAPAEISKALAKVKWAKQQLKLAQKFWTDEDTEELLEMNPDWNLDTIHAFLNCNFDTDLIIEFVEGSEIPQSLIERQLTLQNLLTQLMQMGQIAPEFVKADLLTQILTDFTKASGITIDIGNNESNMRLAEARYDHLAEILKTIPPTQDLGAVQQVSAQIAQMPIFHPLPYESFDVLIEFYSDKARNEAASENPNYVMLGCLNTLIMLEQQAKVQHAQEQSQMAMSAQAPMMEAQQQMMQQQAQQEQQSQQADQQHQMQLKAMDQQQQAQNPQAHLQFLNDEAQRDHEKETQLRDLQDANAERTNRIQLGQLQNKRAAKGASK